MTDQNELMNFAPEDIPAEKAVQAPWRVLVVDDDGEVHQATRYALEGVELLGRPLTLIHAYSAAEAEQLLRQMPDIAVVLLDVVMESDDSGLCLIDLIRDQLNYRCLRIILRTGQPGTAPESTLVARYDIHDYMLKTDVSHERLVTSLTTAVRTYQQLANMALMERQLASAVRAVDRCLDLHQPETFAQFYCQQLKSIYQLSPLMAVFWSPEAVDSARIVAVGEGHQAWLGQALSSLTAEADLLDYVKEAMLSSCANHTDCLLLSSAQHRLLVLLSDDNVADQVIMESWQVFHSLMGVCFKHVC
ncbi:MAG: DUF3369 domain-containing protein [Thiotrichales bacterium]|nr:MAG: DUF3369 domain-containing protein [Thiotrichales bacterium]